MKYIFMPVLVACISLRCLACDVCGGSSGNYIGILPEYKRHFIGLSYQHQVFLSTHPEMFTGLSNVQSRNSINSVTAWASLSPAKKLQVFAFVPYVQNIATELTEDRKSTRLNSSHV